MPMEKMVAGGDDINAEFELRHLEFKMNCNDGDGDGMACHSLGEWHAVVKQDYASAADIYRKNCDKQNYSASCFNLARLFLAGKGVEQDDAQAAKYSEKACVSGTHNMACDHAAQLALFGIGGPKRPQKAIELLDKACQRGIPESCSRLANIYLQVANFVPQSPPACLTAAFVVAAPSGAASGTRPSQSP